MVAFGIQCLWVTAASGTERKGWQLFCRVPASPSVALRTGLACGPWSSCRGREIALALPRGPPVGGDPACSHIAELIFRDQEEDPGCPSGL